VMETEVDICPRCGGTIVETLEHAGQRLDRLEELECEPGFDYGQHDERRADV
jgi:Zn-finger nucleic acid-binding protein